MKLKFKKIFVLFIFTILFVSNQKVFSWGVKGHKVIAQIAKDIIEEKSPEFLRFIEDSFICEKDFADISKCSDDAKKVDKFVCANCVEVDSNKCGHFLDLPVYGEFSDKNINDICDKFGTCVIREIDKCINTLKTADINNRDKRQAFRVALIELIHLVGDVSCPMHCADNDDYGGNRTWVKFEPSIFGKHVRLHAAWDEMLNEASTDYSSGVKDVPKEEYVNLAQILKEGITQEEYENFSQINFKDFARSSFEIGQKIYEEHVKSQIINEEYRAIFMPLIEKQLKKAGVKLASILQEVLSENPSVMALFENFKAKVYYN